MKRLLNTFNVVLFLAAILAIAAVINYFAQRAQSRLRIDATKTRAYSLSQQTRNLLRDLDGQWTIALLMVQDEIDRAVRRQIDEVLHRFTQAAPNISVIRIDPTDPRTLADYERVLADLRLLYEDGVEQYETSLDAGRAAYAQVILLAQQQAGTLQELIEFAQRQPDFDAKVYEPVLQRAQTLGLIAEQGDEVLAEADRAQRIDGSRPIPDYESARSILAYALTNAANELYETAEAFADWAQQSSLLTELRAYASANRADLDRRARDLARIADPLRHLPELELSVIGQQLATGEAALILSPSRAAVIPSQQLFPRSNFRRESTGVITFDQRFRGETLLAAAMRALLVEHMPMVVFMHAEDGSWLRPRDRQIDLFGVTSMLQASRFQVKEWNVNAPSSERPTPERGQPVVWIPIPPPQRSGIEPSRNELQLIEQVRRLIHDGESVLVSVYPSLLPRYGQVDPWASIGQPFGVNLNTGRVIYESFRTGSDQTLIHRSQLVQRYTADHPIARAVTGQLTHYALPTTIQLAKDAPEEVQHEVILAIEPDENRWLESNWSVDPDTLPAPQPEQRLDGPEPIVMAVSRPNPFHHGDQRALFVGSGGWMLTYIADAVTGLGGERYALDNPGNHELMLASVAWLAGMDELIAQSPTGQEVARLGEISEAASRFWFWLVVIAMPVGSLGLGLLVWVVRRT